jgi:hypothetical protein
MKTILVLAAVVASLATASVASAHDSVSGHWEWKTLPTFGPKSTGPSRIRVWIKDSDTSMANCDCDMMKMSPDDCMKGMHHMGPKPSAG